VSEGLRSVCRPSPFFEPGVAGEDMRMGWDNGSVRPVAFAQLGQQYRRYRWRSARRGSDGRVAAALGSIVAADSLYAGWGTGSTRRLQTSGSGHDRLPD